MEKELHDVSLRVVKALNVALMTAPFAVCWYTAYAGGIASPYYAKGNWLVVALFALLYFTYGRIYEGFCISLYRISEVIYSQSLAALISDGILYFVIWLLSKSLPGALPLLAALAAQVVLSAVWAYCAHRWYFSAFRPKTAAVIHDTRRGMEELIHEYGLTQKFSVVQNLSVQECLADGLRALDGIEAVFLCGIHSHDRNIILKYCTARDIDVYLLPRIGDVIMSGAVPMHLFHLPVLRSRRYSPPPEYLLLKRLFDLVSSGAVLMLLSPLMLAVAAAIKATDGGPVLYRQCRLTKDGRRFYVHKFRSMRVDAEKDGVARLSTGDKDDRVTPVGRLIRKCRIDELPQLFDILKGDMSVVGPRPERPEIAAQYEQELPEFALRLQAKAGLTGYAQVYGKYNTSPYDKLQMDLMYIAHPSLAEDLLIIFATIKILFIPESTEGVAQESAAAIEQENQNGTEEKKVCPPQSRKPKRQLRIRYITPPVGTMKLSDRQYGNISISQATTRSGT